MSENSFTPGQLLVLDPRFEYGYGAFPCDIHGAINDIEREIEIAQGQPIMFIKQLVGPVGTYDVRAFSLVLVGDRYGALHETYLQPFNPSSLNKEI